MYKMALKLLKKSLSKKSLQSKSILFAFAIGALSGVGYVDFTKREWYSQDADLKAINVCFTPPSGCSELIAREISHASNDLYIQAYGFTSQKIVNQILAAHNKGVEVNVLLDKSNLTDRYSKIMQLTDAGIKVKVDKLSGIAHNKVIIIDSQKVITGSFNFTNNADQRNAENVLLIQDANLAATYLKNWHARYAAN